MAPAGNSLDRSAIIRIAAELIDADNAEGRGLDALSLKRIAAKAGVTHPARNRHVANLDDVWRDVGLAARTQLADSLAEAAIGVSEGAAVRAIAAAWRDFGRKHPGRYRSTERSPVSGNAALEAAVQRVVDVIVRSLRSYGLPEHDLIQEALLMRSALHGFVSFEFGDGHPLDPPVNETFERLVDLLVSSVDSMVDAKHSRRTCKQLLKE
jgi:AcrR family transcriptional regulator